MDMQAAAEAGAQAVGVVTGVYTVDELGTIGVGENLSSRSLGCKGLASCTKLKHVRPVFLSQLIKFALWR